jgi:hypothetical protein
MNTNDPSSSMTQAHVFRLLDWWVLTLRCLDCHHVAASFIAPRGSVTEQAIVSTGAWHPVVQEIDGRPVDFVRNPCRCKWPNYPSPDSCRREIRRAINKGLGDLDEHKAVTVRRKPRTA